MRRLLLKACRIAVAVGLAWCVSTPARAAIDFASSTPLASGTWAKVGVTENGVYEISYDQLRLLGFKNPEKVCVWGEGGIMYSPNFIDKYDNRLIPDNLTPVRVLHKNSKIYFYAKGPENLTWATDSKLALGIRCIPVGLNLYSNYGIYLLSDTDTPVAPSVSSSLTTESGYVSKGVSYVYHEKDINQGNAYSSQEFWGEDFLGELTSSQTFPYNARGMSETPKASLGVRFMAQSGNYQPVYYGLEDDYDNKIITRTGYVTSVTTYYRMNETQCGNVNLKSKTGHVKIEAPDNGDLTLQKRLDWWVLTYERNLDFDGDENQFSVHAQFANVANIKVPEGSDVEVWDISMPNRAISLQPNSDRIAPLNYGWRDLVYFRTNMEQKKPMLLESVGNQNLHALALSENPSMIIFTTDELLPYANELANFHKEYEGKGVIAVSARQVYNEFSSGRPDPMAFRSFAKMIKDKPGSNLEAVLFYGPIRANIRKQEPDGTLPDVMIAYQSEMGLTAVNTNCIMDIYGMLGDGPITTTSTATINSTGTSILLSTPMDIAVGVLPVLSSQEAERVNKKTIKYITEASKPYWSDRMIYFCDDYDDALHVTQSERLSSYFLSRSNNNATLVKAYAGEYGKANIINKVTESLNEGAIAINYIGHGSTSAVGMTEFMETSDVLKMHNSRPTFMNFAGCMATMYENGIRGIPEHMALSTNYGLVGGQLSVRTSYANENESYMTEWQRNLLGYCDESGRPLSIGEVTRRTKNNITDNNGKLKFHLFGDPLLRLPIATGKVIVDKEPEIITPGSVITLSGSVEDLSESSIKDFNGTLVAKWIEAPHKEKIVNKISGYKGGNGTSHPTGYNDSTVYCEKIIDTQTFEIKDGKFDIRVAVPEQLGPYMGNTVRLSLVAHDASKEINAWRAMNVTLAESDSTPAPDTEAPVIEELKLLEEHNGKVHCDVTIKAVVTDNIGIRVDEISPDMPLALMLDGKRYNNLMHYSLLENGSRQLSIIIPVENLSMGHHTLELTTTDYAGNRTSGSINFEVVAEDLLKAPLLAEEICRTQATLSLEEEGQGAATLIIIDAFGSEIYRAPFIQNMKWNLKNSKGVRVTPGIYKAHVVYNDAEGSNNTSTQWLTIPVLSEK